MRFEVPQFIEREAKVVGPLTIKQFVALAIPGTVILVAYATISNFTVFLSVAAVLGFIGFAFAFLKVEGKPLTTLILQALNFTVGAKTYAWKQERIAPQKKAAVVYRNPKAKEEHEKKGVELQRKSRLADLSTQVTTKA